MTAMQMVGRSRFVRVMYGQIVIYITKTEAKRLVREYDLPNDEVATVHINGENVCSIIFSA